MGINLEKKKLGIHSQQHSSKYLYAYLRILWGFVRLGICNEDFPTFHYIY